MITIDQYFQRIPLTEALFKTNNLNSNELLAGFNQRKRKKTKLLNTRHCNKIEHFSDQKIYETTIEMRKVLQDR